jgi:carbonic anhydrase/acetyltransferase-like protein (isoleucine patch superfamily)
LGKLLQNSGLIRANPEPSMSAHTMQKTHSQAPGGLILPYRGAVPRCGADVFIAPNAVVIGNVELGDRANVWFNCLIRGDGHYIRIGPETNVQDGTIIHISTDKFPTVIGARVTIGHAAVIHACTIEDDTMIGIGAIVLDGAVVERGAIVAAGAVVSPGKRVPAGEMWTGCPARFQRRVKPSETEFIAWNARNYCATAAEYREAL